MILFQWLAVPILLLAFAMDAFRTFRAAGQRRMYAFRACLWAAAALAIADPSLTSRVAQVLGITRGADLVLYLFALAFLVVSLLFYARLMRLQHDITDLVRVLALQQARPPGDEVKNSDPV